MITTVHECSKELILYGELFQKVVDELAFEIHEAQYDIKKWDNKKFIEVLDKYTSLDRQQGLFKESNIRITTSLGDVFEYWVKENMGFPKRINGIEVFGNFEEAYIKNPIYEHR